MERVTFLLEDSGERLSCLLNPESLVVRRTAGLARRRSLGGPLTGNGLADDPWIATGGGRTEMRLDLLFDLFVAGSTVAADDVRQLTLPLWRLAENGGGDDGAAGDRLTVAGPPAVRFIWGKAWNVPGVVAALAERLENFSAGGAPTRSWLRMRLIRIAEAAAPAAALAPEITPDLAAPDADEVPADRLSSYQLLGGGPDEAGGERVAAERLDQVAQSAYGDPGLWRVLASFNGIDDPMNLAAGTVVQIPDRLLLTSAGS